MAPAQRLTILLSAHDVVGHRALAAELLDAARDAGLAGASLFEGVAGSGRSGRLHGTHLVREDAPLALVMIDGPDAIAAYLERVSALARDCVVLLEDVEAYRA